MTPTEQALAKHYESPLLGPLGIGFMALYLISLIGIGWLGKRARKEVSLADHFLGGRELGFGVLFLTLYATQYSGNTLIGFAGEAYRDGFRFLVSVTFMIGVVGCFALFAPAMQRLAGQRNYVTIGDFIRDRYGSQFLAVAVTVLGIIGLGNYVLTNLKAIGVVVESATGGRIAAYWGIIGLSLIMVVYETMGGMRSVAWTDAIQGVMLMTGCVLIVGVVEYHYGGLTAASDYILKSRPEMWRPPTAEQFRTWLSRLFLVFFGISMYPHAIQRFFAARNAKSLQRSLQVMAFMPLLTTFLMFIVGVVGAAQFPGLDKSGSEQVTMLLLRDMAEHIPGVQFLIILFISAAIAAIMSTIDSALLAISSMFTQDICRQIWPTNSQAKLTKIGKWSSWLIMAVMAAVAIKSPSTIWMLIVIKLEILCQVAPAILLGINFKRLTAGPVIAGLVIGCSITIPLRLISLPDFAEMVGVQPISGTPLGIHLGIWGLCANFLVIALLASIWPSQPKAQTN